jgi:hypothetical protein
LRRGYHFCFHAQIVQEYAIAGDDGAGPVRAMVRLFTGAIAGASGAITSLLPPENATCEALFQRRLADAFAYHMMINTAIGNENVISTILTTMHALETNPTKIQPPTHFNEPTAK